MNGRGRSIAIHARPNIRVDRIDGYRLHLDQDLVVGGLWFWVIAVDNAFRRPGLFDIRSFHPRFSLWGGCGNLVGPSTPQHNQSKEGMSFSILQRTDRENYTSGGDNAHDANLARAAFARQVWLVAPVKPGWERTNRHGNASGIAVPRPGRSFPVRPGRPDRASPSMSMLPVKPP